MNHVYSSRSGDGWRNLATDEYLIEKYRSREADGVTLYFYVNSDAVIIGRNQNAWRECRIDAMERDGVQLVRRHTGGGAVYHDSGNLNFSFITDEKHYDKARFTNVILSACRSLGIEAEVTGRNDLTVAGRKFSGCAYALCGVARGMHGTLLVDTDMSRLSEYLAPSKLKLAAKGVQSVRSRVVNLSEIVPVTVEDLRSAVIAAFEAEFGECEPLEFSSDELEKIDALTAKMGSWEWRMGSSPAFDHAFEGRFSFGELRIQLHLRNGAVSGADVYTDSLDTELPEKLRSLLIGARFGADGLAKSLRKGGAEANEVADRILTDMNDTFTSEAAELITKARRELHALAEPSNAEKRTKAYIVDFLKRYTDLEITDEGSWLYAAHRENEGETVAVRADFDAVSTPCGARHLCGHDGHTSALFGLALMLKGRRIGRNVILLFQHAEENGAGAKECCALFEKERVDRIIGCHNIPGEEFGTVLLAKGTFACASCGMEIKLKGAPTHAAYPENGKNPTAAAAELALGIPEEASRIAASREAMTLATVVGMRTGERAFGVAAAEGTLWITLRSEKTEALDELVSASRELTYKLASRDGLFAETELFDVFPATVNDDSELTRIENALRENAIPYKYLDAPFRWSEDFGHYGSFVPAVFFGVGSGKDTAPLHTENYEYPDALALRTARIFAAVIGENQ